jgi:rod shape determining protein RodA
MFIGSMRNFLNHIKKMDWILAGSAVLLSGLGMVSILSSSIRSADFVNFHKQILFFIVGFILMIVVSFVDWRILRDQPYLILSLYFFCLLGLAGLFFLAPEIHGTKSWYKIGAISLDPIEFSKFILLILLAKYFSMRHVEMYQIRHIILSGVYILIPAALIFFQPNLGPVLVLFGVWAGILLISGIKIRHFLLLGFCGILVVALGWAFVLKDYQKERIIGFILPQADPLGVNWNQNQAKIAIGSGGIWGRGIGKGPQTQYGFLPAPQTDFIFASIAEETGLIGVSVIFTLFLLFFYRIIKIAINSKTNFPRLFAAGFAVLIMVQVFINIGMNLGILPIIGIPLPLLSYGGSNLVTTFLALGILQSIRVED